MAPTPGRRRYAIFASERPVEGHFGFVAYVVCDPRNPFNDWHAVMACLGAGRDSDVDRLVSAYRSVAEGSDIAEWGRRTAVPLIEGFAAFWRGDYERAADRLHSTRFIANSFGGSHAQRDVIDWTLAEAAARGPDPPDGSPRQRAVGAEAPQPRKPVLP